MSRLLALHGSKGCGKSVLAASLAYEMKAKGLACAIFSYYHGIERQKTSVAMLATVLWQLLHLNQLPDSVLDPIYDSISTETVTNTYLLDTIEKVARIFPHPIHIIIDGVDESKEDWNDNEGPLRIIRRCLETQPKIRVLLVGRKAGLHLALRDLHRDNIIELAEDLTKNDIAKFIAYKLGESPSLEDMSPNLKRHVQETLQDMSTGMFLWIELVFKELRKCYSPAAVCDCLAELPRSLDDEYFRLFKQLMYRLHSCDNKPSSQTKTARTLLAFVVGAVEPLSVDELRYAYAAICDNGTSWEDHLISGEAVFDFLGDFVVFKDGHVHFSHASVEEFLLRPLSEWPERQNEIGFFRLNHMECQQLIGNSCLQYLTAVDLGYPIADDSYDSLSRKPFLIYATKNGPLHWTHSLAFDPREFAEVVAKLKAFIAMPRFAGLVEYLALALLNDSDFIKDSSNLFLLAEASGNELRECLVLHLRTESERRLAQFPPGDKRTQSWRALESICTDFLTFGSPATFIDGLLNDSLESQVLSQAPTKLSGSSGLPSPSHEVIAQSSSTSTQLATQYPNHHCHSLIAPTEAMGSIIRSNMTAIVRVPLMSRALQIWVDPRKIQRKTILAMVAKMPLALHLFYTNHTFMEGDFEMAQSLSDLALQRTQGQRSLYRALALQEAGILLPSDLSCATEEDVLFSQAYDILSALQENPIAYLWMPFLVALRIPSLAYLGKFEEMEKIVNELDRRPAITSSSFVQKQKNVMLDHIIHKQTWCVSIQAEGLKRIATALFDEQAYETAHQVYEKIIERKRNEFGPRHWMSLSAEITVGDVLMRDSRFLDAERHFRGIIEQHNEDSIPTAQKHLIAECRIKLARAVTSQGKSGEAVPLFQDARAHPSKKGDICWRHMCTIWIGSGLQSVGDFKTAKSELETISITENVELMLKGKLKKRKISDLYWNVICAAYSHLGEHQNVVAVRRTVHSLLDESSRLSKYITENVLELIKTLRKVSSNKEAANISMELSHRIARATQNAETDKRPDTIWGLMRDAVKLVEALRGLEDLEDARTACENVLRWSLEEINHHQETNDQPVQLISRPDARVLCVTSDFIHGSEHELTLRFADFLSGYDEPGRFVDEENPYPVLVFDDESTNSEEDFEGSQVESGYYEESDVDEEPEMNEIKEADGD